MRKRRNRVYRRIAVALTVALLAGQSHAFVLAEEDAGGAPQTEITGEADTSTPDNDSASDNDNTPDGGKADNGNTDNGNADNGNVDNGSGGNTNGTGQGGSNGGTDNQNPDDNGNQGDQQGDGDGQDKCICETKCVEDAVNPDCPVCAENYEACAGQADDEGNDDSGNGDTEDNDSENGGQDNPDGSAEGIADGQKCICETTCTEENVNMDCPVCAVDYANCAKKAEEGENLSVNAALPEMAPASMADEEAGIDALADEGVEAYAVGDTIQDSEGILYRINTEKKEASVVGHRQGKNRIDPIVIPESVTKDGITYQVTSIGDSAFYRYYKMEGVTLPESLICIGDSAFGECDEISSIEIPNKVESIGDSAFLKCYKISSVNIPDSVTSIGDNAFSCCSGISSVEISKNISSIGNGIFGGCSSLTSVKIPKGVTSIGDDAFLECSNLTSIEIPDSVTSIGKFAFCKCKSLISLELPDSVTSIGTQAFSWCHSLTRVNIPSGVTCIEEMTFFYCNCLNSIEIPSTVTSIGESAFQYANLTSVKIPKSVTSIGRRAFLCCFSLTDVEIPNGMISIEESAFDRCSNLDTLKIAISSNQKYHFPTVGKDAFAGLPDSRNDIIIIKGADLSDDDLEAADVASAFHEADVADGSVDGLWYGWPYKGVVVKDTHKVTITVQKDDTPWTTTTGCDRTFALTKDGGTTLVTNFDAVEAGEYEIYDVTDSGKKLDTGVTVTVADTDVSSDPVEYYTVAFCYLDDDGNEQTYGDSTDWKPQIVLKDKGRVAEPATNPTKADHTFGKWVTAPDGDDAFAFETTPITAKDTKIYAKWKENTVTTYHTVTFYDGDVPYGADTPQKPQSVADGQKADRPDDPEKAGWEFAGWKTKTADGGSTDYNFDTPVTGDTNIYASWVKKTVTDSLRIQATATEGGTIAPKGEVIVSKGGERTFTITPNEGNKIKAVTVDDEDVTAELKDTRARAQTGARYYTFTNIVKDHTIHAEFERDGSSSGGGGGDNPNPGGDNPGGGSGGGGGGDNPDSGNDDDNKKPGSGGGNSGGGDNGGGNTNSGGGNNGGGTSPDGGNGTGNTANADTGNGAGNGQTVAGTVASSAQAGSGAAAASAGSNTAFDGSKAAGGSTSGVAGTAANGKEPKTGDASYLEVYATLAMIAGLTYLLLYVMEESRGMSEREKEAFVAAFIRWGKKGGAFRKCCAMAAIFCLLAYYHIIGKNVGENALRKKHLGQAF